LVTAGAANAELFLRRPPQPPDPDYQLDVKLQTTDGKLVAKTEIWLVNQDEQKLIWGSSFVGNDYSANLQAHARRQQPKGIVVFIAPKGYLQPPPVPIVVKKNPGPVVIELEPALAVKVVGRIVDGDGKPVAGALIRLSRELFGKANAQYHLWSPKARRLPETDAEGRFEIADVLPGSRVAVYVNKAEYAGAWSPWKTVEKSADLRLGDLVLKKSTRELTGKVVNDKNQPVPGARVFVRDIAPAETVTDAEGRFRLAAVPEGEIVVAVDGLDYEMPFGQPVAADVKEVTLRLVRE
jgi:hypothetical protein